MAVANSTQPSVKWIFFALQPPKRKPLTWAETTIYESNNPIRPWALQYIKTTTKFLYKLTGFTTRSPGLYKKVDPQTGHYTSEYLDGTNERVHPSVRVRLACAGLGANDSDIWYCPALLKNWHLRRVPQQFVDPVSSMAKWGPSITGTPTRLAAQLSEDQTTTESTASTLTESLQMTSQNSPGRWVWEYIGPEDKAPAIRTMVEENLGPFEQRLLELAAGKVPVFEFAETQDASQYKAFYHQALRKTMKVIGRGGPDGR